MPKNRSKLIVWALASVAIILGVVVVLEVFGSGATTTADASTAIGSLSAAESALATTAPDARLMVVQMLSSVTTTDTPSWEYLFGSPSTDMGYLVYASDGAIMTFMEYGSLGLTEEEWAQVPETDSLKIDSDEAYAKALAASGANGTPYGYFMGLITYKSSEDTSAVEPFEWNVWLEPGTSGATSNRILVDAESGEVSVTDSE